MDHGKILNTPGGLAVVPAVGAGNANGVAPTESVVAVSIHIFGTGSSGVSGIVRVRPLEGVIIHLRQLNPRHGRVEYFVPVVVRIFRTRFSRIVTQPVFGPLPGLTVHIGWKIIDDPILIGILIQVHPHSRYARFPRFRPIQPRFIRCPGGGVIDDSRYTAVFAFTIVYLPPVHHIVLTQKGLGGLGQDLARLRAGQVIARIGVVDDGSGRMPFALGLGIELVH